MKTKTFTSPETSRINIGHQVITRSNRKRRCIDTVTDILRTYNNDGELVKIEYIAEHEFCGQSVKTVLCGTTIKMGETIKEAT